MRQKCCICDVNKQLRINSNRATNMNISNKSRIEIKFYLKESFASFLIYNNVSLSQLFVSNTDVMLALESYPCVHNIQLFFLNRFCIREKLFHWKFLIWLFVLLKNYAHWIPKAVYNIPWNYTHYFCVMSSFKDVFFFTTLL